MTDQEYINRCIELALRAKGETYPNPMVGCVIVYKDKIIGEGYHHKAGEPHAEIMAINSVEDKSLLPQSSIYVSLEPCSHFGKTPPCANKIIEIGFKRVVIGTLDFNDKVNGKGQTLIENAGIEVTEPVLQKECQELNKRFFCFHQKKRPYIILKWAESQDGYIDKDFKPYSISNSLCKQYVHQLRSEEHSILVGTKTAITDNPSLTTREVSGRNPIRIVIDLELKIPTSNNIYNAESETIIFNSKLEKIENNISFIKIEREHLIENLVHKLYQKNIQSVLVEGGSQTLQSFINSGVWDEAIVIKNPELQLFIGTKSPELNKTPKKIETLRNNTLEFYKNDPNV